MSDEKTQEIAVPQSDGRIIGNVQRAPTAIAPRDIAEAHMLAKMLVRSGLTPFEQSEECLLVMLDAMEKGKPIIQHLQSRYVVHGRVGMYAAAMVADVLASGKAVYFRPLEQSDLKSVWETVRADWPKGAPPQRFSFTIQEAKKAGLLSNKKYAEMPQRMLSARASSFLCRDIYPDVMAGVYSVEELEDEEAINPRKRTGAGRRAAPVTGAEPAVEVESSVVGELTAETEPEAREAADADTQDLTGYVIEVNQIIDEAIDLTDENPDGALSHLNSAVPKITILKDKGLSDETLSELRTAFGDCKASIRTVKKELESEIADRGEG